MSDATIEHEGQDQREQTRRQKIGEAIHRAIEDAPTDELLEVVTKRHSLGPWGLVELLLDHGEGIILAEWDRVTPDGAPDPPDVYFMAIHLSLTPRYARAIIANAGGVGRTLLTNHASEILRDHYEWEVVMR